VNCLDPWLSIVRTVAHSAETWVAQPTARPLTTNDLQACAALDRLALGGLWNETQWQRDWLKPIEPCLGLGAKDPRLWRSKRAGLNLR